MTLKRKKGNMLSIILIMSVCLVLAMGIIITGVFMSRVNEQVQSMDFIDAHTKEVEQGINDKYIPVFDGFFLTFLIGSIIASVIGAYFINSHPLFFIITIILFIFAIIIAMIISNIYASASAPEIIYAYAQNFPVINYVMNNLVSILVGYVILISVAMYAGKERGYVNVY